MRRLLDAVIPFAAALLCSLQTTHGQEPVTPTQSASSTSPSIPAPGHSIHGQAFDEGPRQLATRLEGQGAVDFSVTTKNPQAREFVNQGIAQLHTFYYYEAERSFRQAAKLDPECAMAYWGMAMANASIFTPNLKRISGFLDQAKKRQASATPREQEYIKTLAESFKEGLDEKARKKAFLAGMERIVQDYPDDLDARSWMAMAAWQEGTLGSRQSVDTVLDTVLAKNPMHPGAHHYRIHLWDGTNAARALPSAGLYAKAAPGIAHAWHMPGHTYTELKRYAEAAFQQEGSARVDHAAMNATRVMPFEIHNYAHNNQWLVTSLLHVGRVREALAVAWNLVEQPRDPQKNGPNDGGSAQRSGRARLADAYLRYELWEPLLEAAAAGDLDWADNAIEKKERAYTLGVAHYATGDRAKLTEQILELKKLREAETKPAPPPTSPTPAPPPQSDTKSAVALTGPPPPDRAAPPVAGASPAEQPELAELEGYEKLLDRAFAAAFDRFSKASRMRPESLARAHLAARNFGLAEAEAKRAVEKAPNQFPAMACLVEVLAACDRTSDAQQAFATLAPLLDSADPDTPVVKRLAKLAASWKLSGWDKPSPVISSSASTPREDLSALGPLTWSPFPAADFALQDTKGNAWRLEAHRGRSVLLLFFLGGKCAHCLQQLQEFGKQFEALKTIGVDVVAVSTDALEASKDLKNNSDGIKFPMPILSDSGLDTFKQYRSFDDFENQPLHGTFLIDRTGQIRFQRISADPFLDVDFIKTEAARVERNLGRASKTSNRELTSRASGTSSAGR